MADVLTLSKILVLGSMGRETVLVPRGGNQVGYWQKQGWVGAPLLRKMICEALVEMPDDPTRTDLDTKEAEKAKASHECARVRPDEPSLDDSALVGACVGITTVFKRTPKTSKPKEKEFVLRVAREFSSYPLEAEASAPLFTHMETAIADCRDPDILVLFDFDEESRHAARASLSGLSHAHGQRTTIIGFAGDTHSRALDWLDQLTPEISGGANRTVAVLRAQELRKAGLIIVESGPIERTVRDLLPYLDREPLATLKAHALHLVILFEEIGAVYLDLTARCANGQIHLSSNLDAIAHDNADKYGRTPGRMSITLAAIARRLSTEKPGQPVPDLSGAIRLSLAADHRYFSEGYDADGPLGTLQSALSYRSRLQIKTLLEGNRPDSKYFLSTLRFPREPLALGAWTRLDDAFSSEPDLSKHEKKNDASRSRLRDIVLRGPEAALHQKSSGPDPWYPEARILCPYMRVGDIRTFDEEEIAGFTSLMRLFGKYLQDKEWKTPLSIGVFGPPGTGKSFGVKELMKTVNPAAERPLTFNLSQLRSVDALNDAFHDVQHRVLSSDDVPLVFFDEFDTSFEGRLGWLKYFLAPMQDGVFRSKASDYSIGRAFFVFAGGTTASFAEFKDLATGTSAAEAKAAKLPDFVSRLQSFLDIQSINSPMPPAVDSPQKELQRRVKRALLLRSFLQLHANMIFRKTDDDDVPNIDHDLIDALLSADRYLHGSRSLESIVRMSKWIDGRFVPASLPARALLEMHVSGLTLRGPGGPTVLC